MGFYLCKCSQIIGHVKGEKNVMPNIMTHWCRGYRGKRYSIKRVPHILPEQDSIESPLSEEFSWPDIACIKQSQRDHRHEAGDEVKKCEGFWTIGEKNWIPENDAELQLKLFSFYHCGSSGHQGRDTTPSIGKENVWWKMIAKKATGLGRLSGSAVVR